MIVASLENNNDVASEPAGSSIKPAGPLDTLIK